MNTTDIFDKEKKYFLQTYKRIPIEIVSGSGVYLSAKNGDKYLDFMSGLGVNALGYSHPRIIEAVTKQIKKISHLSNYFITDIQTEFADKLLRFSKMDKLFLTNSGTEAIEGVIKLIRMKFGQDKKIYSLTNSFHGRTYGSLTLTERKNHRLGFEPLLKNIDYIKFNNIEDLKDKVNENTAAIFVEFIQGEGGIQPISNDFANEITNLKKEYDFSLVADEIQSGIGRTGKNFTYQHYNVNPDIIVSAKAIGGGLPLGAFMIKNKLNDILDYGKHGTTFGGNPVCCAAGIAVLDYLSENNLISKVDNLSIYFFEKLNNLKEKYPNIIKDIRGKGFMIGIEVNNFANEIVNKFRDKKIIVNLTATNVLRLLPPLIMEQKHLDIFLDIFDNILIELS
ncbi:MAG: aspartate aminotransferase family protein [Ignavibacteriales bacterium CG_4_9_14_3_um_filter_30_11]|nr:MAG: aspartate aminotransferase family protein [Ignavibacteriales bacterium CG_4_9_14_3_um_filter_30_11]